MIYLSEINLSMLARFQEGEVILMSREEILEAADQLCRLLKYEFIFVPVSDIASLLKPYKLETGLILSCFPHFQLYKSNSKTRPIKGAAH